jgi:hypothetical protein
MKTLRILLLLLLSTSIISTVSAQMDLDGADLKDQVFFDDLIVFGSACVGQDCVNGENFGFDTGRYRENNLRIHFFDTSNSASFPTNDWRIVINDSSNGGANYFAVEDSDASRQVFRIEAGAQANAIYARNNSVGLGTSSPIVELHITDGDSPTIRLEQDGSSGFTPQTWDVAGNESNFFVRDVTNGSSLAFRIKPGSGTDDALYIDSDGDIGMGTDSPKADLHIRNNTISEDVSFNIENAADSGDPDADVNLIFNGDGEAAFNFEYGEDRIGFVSCTNNGKLDFGSGVPAIQNMRLTEVGRLGIGTLAPTTTLEVNGTASKPGGGQWSVPSDKRLKKNIGKYTLGLQEILQLNPVTFQYNGKGGIADTKTSYTGLIAQEVQKIIPPMVETVKRGTLQKVNGDDESIEYEHYLSIDPSSIQYMLINAIKEQQVQIEDKDQRIEELESKLDKVELLVSDLIDKLGGETFEGQIDNIDNITLSLDQLPYLKQNVPNPYNKETSIEYFVPEFSKRAEIHFFDNQGRMLKKYPISQNGTGKLNLRSENLPAGTYVYSLFVDGKMVSSKKMSIQ